MDTSSATDFAVFDVSRASDLDFCVQKFLDWSNDHLVIIGEEPVREFGMFVQCVHIRIKPGRVAEFLEVFRDNFDGTRAEPGNYRFDVLQDPEDENHFVIYEAFADEAAVDAHRKTAHYARTVEGLKDLMSTDTREKDFFHMVMPDHAAAIGGE